jgi:electron transport complex protein RnfD
MKFEVRGAPHIPAVSTVNWTMAQVLFALIPGVIAHMVFFGPGILIQMLIASLAALAFEAAMLRMRGRPLQPFLTDLSAPVTAVLYALCLPPLMPWWAAIIGMFFAIVVAKHLYGGLGYNIFNPALVGFVVILVSFPLHATSWLPPMSMAEFSLSFGDTLAVIFTGTLPDGLTWDAITRATPLDLLRTASTQDLMMMEVLEDPIFGDFGGRGWESIGYWFALGGAFLLYRRVISWHVPVAMLATIFGTALIFYMVDAYSNPFPMQQIFTGGVIFGAFFIATDPVSGCVSPRGRLIFGAGVALIAIAIRRWGGYPDGVAFGILIMNMAAPFIDRYTRTRTYGR